MGEPRLFAPTWGFTVSYRQAGGVMTSCCTSAKPLTILSRLTANTSRTTVESELNNEGIFLCIHGTCNAGKIPLAVNHVSLTPLRVGGCSGGPPHHALLFPNLLDIELLRVGRAGPA